MAQRSVIHQLNGRLSLGLIILLINGAKVTNGQCQMPPIKLAFEKMELLNNALEAFPGIAHSDCATKCHLRLECKSINYDPVARRCQLNSATALSNPGDISLTSPSMTYIDIEKWPQNALKIHGTPGSDCTPYMGVHQQTTWSFLVCGTPPQIEDGTIVGEGFIRQIHCLTYAETTPCHSIGTISCINNAWTPFACKDVPRMCNDGLSDRGRLERFIGTSWSPLCIDDVEPEAVAVACAELGYPYGGAYHEAVTFGEGLSYTPSHRLENLLCTGTEKSLTDCYIKQVKPNACNHDKDVGITCYSQPMGGAQLRIVDEFGFSGPEVMNGRPEVFCDGEWGTLCEKDWENNDVKVFCKTINPTWKEKRACGNACKGAGTGKICTAKLKCEKENPNFFTCKNSGWGFLAGECKDGHSKDAGIECQLE